MTDVITIVLVFGGFFSFLLAISPVGKAVADRIRGGGLGVSHELANRVDDLIEEVENLRSEMMEVGERVDFLERVLSPGAEDHRLPRGASGKE